MVRFVASIAAISALAASPVLAAEMRATVSGDQNSVLVSRDGALKPLSGLTGSLRQGDRVIAKSGVAKIAFADGCKISLKAGSMFTVGKASPCAASHGGFTKVQTEGGAAAAAGAAGDLVTLPIVGAVTTTTAVGIGVATAVVIGVGAAAASGSFDDSTASP